MSHHLVSMEGVSFSYPNGVEVLRGIDYRIHHGESVGLVGANGAGKSTLLQLLVGIHLATSGVTRVGDWEVSRETLIPVRRCAGLVFQDPDDQLFMPTVAEDVAFGPSHQQLSRAEIDLRVDEALQQLDIQALASRPPHQLSGGERRAAAIATVLAQRPDVLLLDEPSAGLDPRSRRRVMAWIREFSHTRIVASHDLDLVLETCQRTLVLHQGRLVADGPTAKILGNPTLMAQVGLELPLCLQACPRCGSGG